MTGEKTWGVAIPGGWFDERKHIYRDDNGVIVPSTTQVFAILGLTDLERVPEHLLAWKQVYGIAVHKASEYMDQGDLDWDSLDDAIIPAVTGIEQFLKKIQYEPLTTEERRIHSLFGMKYGMTSDGTGTMMYQGVRRHVIRDLKTAVKYSPTWKWQLGAYGLAQEKVEKGWIGLNIQVDKEGNVKPFYHDLLQAGREFQTLLAAANLKLNAGLAQVAA